MVRGAHFLSPVATLTLELKGVPSRSMECEPGSSTTSCSYPRVIIDVPYAIRLAEMPDGVILTKADADEASFASLVMIAVSLISYMPCASVLDGMKISANDLMIDCSVAIGVEQTDVQSEIDHCVVIEREVLHFNVIREAMNESWFLRYTSGDVNEDVLGIRTISGASQPRTRDF